MSWQSSTNAFGATIVIKKYTGVIYGVIPKEGIPSININIKPEEAKKYKNTLKMLLICKAFTLDKLYSPAVKSYYSFLPTFSNPIEIDNDVKMINVEILELWIYDYKTGKIIEQREFY